MVAASTYQAANHTTKVKNDPEDGNILALLMLMGITQHDRALCTPQQTRTYSEEGSGKDEEACILIDIVRQKGGHVEEIAQSSEGEGQSETNPVGNGAGKEADHGEGAIQRCVGVVHVVGVDLASAAESAHGIEHAGAQETDKRNQVQLHLGGGKIRGLPVAQLEQGLVHPCWTYHGLINSGLGV